ncbi:putative sensory transduction regulator [Nocardiopsis sp. Huas11]|uniref:YbjN domain-containing protein n=1 Tax=Nocardiopsis sp. Huas11 TaxID=2183912 RepID=UPI000EB17C3C|nr:YbjN domain-containing protein [Nocardiopsis sp. Huas11]RKS06060.1 putative sensory transduction regulator [Nocardiopsis sp. Huas11]
MTGRDPQVDTQTAREAAARAISEAVAEAGLETELPREGSFLVTIPGTAKLKTLVWLEVGPHSLGVTSFFCRQPDENHGEFYRWLMQRNSGMFGMAFAADEVGDVYIRGRLPLEGVTPAEVDRLLGCVLTYSDENFNRALELGFASAIRKEWRWRAERGHDMRNLRAFAHLAEPHPGGEPATLPEGSA